MKLREIAHSRTGDKGNTSNISVIAFDPANYELLREQVTADRAWRSRDFMLRTVASSAKPVALAPAPRPPR